MATIASPVTRLTIVYSNVYSDADQRKQRSSASLAFGRGIHRGLVNSPYKWPVTWKMFPFDDVIMKKQTTKTYYVSGVVWRSWYYRSSKHLPYYWPHLVTSGFPSQKVCNKEHLYIPALLSLVASSHQAITRTSIDPALCHHMASQFHIELKCIILHHNPATLWCKIPPWQAWQW